MRSLFPFSLLPLSLLPSSCLAFPLPLPSQVLTPTDSDLLVQRGGTLIIDRGSTVFRYVPHPVHPIHTSRTSRTSRTSHTYIPYIPYIPYNPVIPVHIRYRASSGPLHRRVLARNRCKRVRHIFESVRTAERWRGALSCDHSCRSISFAQPGLPPTKTFLCLLYLFVPRVERLAAVRPRAAAALPLFPLAPEVARH